MLANKILLILSAIGEVSPKPYTTMSQSAAAIGLGLRVFGCCCLEVDGVCLALTLSVDMSFASCDLRVLLRLLPYLLLGFVLHVRTMANAQNTGDEVK